MTLQPTIFIKNKNKNEFAELLLFNFEEVKQEISRYFLQKSVIKIDIDFFVINRSVMGNSLKIQHLKNFAIIIFMMI